MSIAHIIKRYTNVLFTLRYYCMFVARLEPINCIVLCRSPIYSHSPFSRVVCLFKYLYFLSAIFAVKKKDNVLLMFIICLDDINVLLFSTFQQTNISSLWKLAR